MIQGQVVLITGASRGIGRAIALELAAQGVKRLLLVARDSQRLQQMVEILQQQYPQVESVPLAVDMTDGQALDGAIARAWRDYGPIDLLINNAGVAHQGDFLAINPRKIEEEINVNLLGTFRITRLIAKRMVSRSQGTIVNVSSLMGKVAAPTYATYSATKFALVGFTQALRQELAPKGVRVVALLPSLTDTDMVRDTEKFRWVATDSAEMVAKSLVAGLRDRDDEIVVGWQGKVASLMGRFFPQMMQKVVALAAPDRKILPLRSPDESDRAA
jgi:3-oxoacyl-[acyl-carrier protein] reductase